jgi:hypothetical protein
MKPKISVAEIREDLNLPNEPYRSMFSSPALNEFEQARPTIHEAFIMGFRIAMTRKVKKRKK